MFKGVPMVLNPNGIEPTFLKLDSWSLGAVFIPIITSNILNYIKKKKLKKKKQFYAYKKHLTQFFKMDSISFWVQFHAHRLKVPVQTIFCTIQLSCHDRRWINSPGLSVNSSTSTLIYLFFCNLMFE